MKGTRFFLLIFCFFLSACQLPNTPEVESRCSTVRSEIKTVQGVSMVPLFRPEDEIEVLWDEEGCLPLEKGDVVLYDYAGNENPVLKKIRGVAGDKLSLKEAGEDAWHILINDRVLKNSENISYVLSGKKYKMLSLYEEGISEDTFLLLGNKPHGTTDSTRFGLIHRKNILGKVSR